MSGRAIRVYGMMRGRAIRVHGTMRGRVHEGVWHQEGKGDVKVGAVMAADDLVLASRNIHGMQNLLNKANAQRKGYILSESKTKVKIINIKYQ